MPIYKIRGVDVDFPYEAYDCQLVYMEKVIQSLQERCNALLESPTGTGKTLCLLCATLAWRKSLGGFRTGGIKGVTDDNKLSQSPAESPKLPTIVYTSRTHSQIRQVIQELKRSNYRPKMVVLGSREQLCIHDKVSLLHGRAQNNACHFVCRKKAKHRCKHYSGVSEYMRHNPYLGDDPIDIEDLVNIGRKSGPCPYYLSRELHKTVDILFSPYNYLIDSGYRKSLALDWTNSVLIFDEAHNLESLCADAASFDLPSGILTTCISEAKDCVDLAVSRRDKSNDKSRNPDNFAILRALLLKLEKRLAEVPIESKELGFTRPGPYIYDLFSDLNVNHATASMLIGIIEEAVVLLEESMQQEDKHSNSICRLETMGDILKLIFKGKDNIHAKHYRFHVREVETRSSDGSTGNLSRTLSWWCFNPGIAMEEFSKLGVGSIILTSGTLSPMDSFAQELNLKFPVRLENPHVISSDQIWVGVVPAGPSGCSFNSSYRNRDSLEYKQDLGNAIVNFARIVPDGLLVFFPSYYILDRCIECWKNTVNTSDSSTVWERICKYKRPVVEPRQTSLFNVSIEDYMSKLNDGSKLGAIFFAVCRGKVSEGLDFADHAGRAVIITGLPYATMTDPKVRLKREFLDEKACSDMEEGKRLTGDEWYNQQASRAVNQAIGRVIRHRNDYGALILCDERFAQPNRQSQISLWIQPHIKCYSRFGDIVFPLTRFFRNKGIDHVTKPKPARSVNSGIVEEKRTMQSLGKPFPVDEDQFDKSISLSHEVKGGNVFSQLGEVTPANRSSLTPYEKTLQTMWTSSGNLLCSGKKLMIPGTGNIRKSCCVVDLTDSSSSEEQIRREIVAPCSTKKRKGSIAEYGEDLLKRHGHDYSSPSVSRHLHSERLLESSYLVENNNSTIHGGSGGKSSQGDFVCQSKDVGNLQRNDIHLSSERGKSAQLDPVPCNDVETQGSTFLLQVREKLSSTEYKEFIGFMKALKSKAMKIGYVLQSIARLFSGPQRLSLSERFKDFIPAKHHLLYDQYLAKYGTTSG